MLYMSAFESKSKDYVRNYNKKYYNENKVKRLLYYENKKNFCDICKNYYGRTKYYFDRHINSNIHKKREAKEKELIANSIN